MRQWYVLLSCRARDNLKVRFLSRFVFALSMFDGSVSSDYLARSLALQAMTIVIHNEPPMV